MRDIYSQTFFATIRIFRHRYCLISWDCDKMVCIDHTWKVATATSVSNPSNTSRILYKRILSIVNQLWFQSFLFSWLFSKPRLKNPVSKVTYLTNIRNSIFRCHLFLMLIHVVCKSSLPLNIRIHKNDISQVDPINPVQNSCNICYIFLQLAAELKSYFRVHEQ